MAKRERLTPTEKLVLLQAANEVLAGEGDGWTVPHWNALGSAAEKLRNMRLPREDDNAPEE